MLKKYLSLFTTPFFLFSLGLFGLVFWLFKGVLFQSHAILSYQNGDIYSQFYYVYARGFEQLRHGHVMLWNPYVFSGTPFLGSFQSVLLYPLSVLYLVLPLARAINGSIALHVFLTGFFMFLWTAHRKLHPAACFVSAVMLMFGGAFFTHLYPGHMTALNSMAWTPLLFLSLDHLLEKRTLRWYLIGILAGAMQLLGGHPQYVYYTFLIVMIYSLLHLRRGVSFAAILGSVLPLYAGTVLLTAAQLFTGMEVSGESIRSSLPPLVASMFSLPPENILTLLVPGLFGDLKTMVYWGRFYLWETNLFVGLTGFALFVHGAIYGRKEVRNYSFILLCVSLLFALGKYTPLYPLFYSLLPYFDHFRGTSKFVFHASLFMAMLAAVGLDDLLRSKRNAPKSGAILLAAGILLAASVLVYALDRGGAIAHWQQFLAFMDSAKRVIRETYLPSSCYVSPDFARLSCGFAAQRVGMSAGMLIVIAAVFFFRARLPKIVIYCLAGVAVVEMLLFAQTFMVTFDERTLAYAPLRRFVAERPGDYRVLTFPNGTNAGMLANVEQINGIESIFLKRYAEFIAFTQNVNPGLLGINPKYTRFPPLLKLLRCRYAVQLGTGTCVLLKEQGGVMPRFSLIEDWKVLEGHNAVFEEMARPGFDPSTTVLLETAPFAGMFVPSRSSAAKGTVTVLDSSTDHTALDISLESPAILVVSDSYSKGWKALPLEGSVQKQYTVMPADHTLQAIPLAKGHHRLQLVYRPRSFIIGTLLSLFSLAVFLCLALYSYFSDRKEGISPLS
jgi:hypothetical protein